MAAAAVRYLRAAPADRGRGATHAPPVVDALPRPDLRCVGTAQDVDAVIASTVEQKADVLVLDLELQGRSSIDVLKTVRKAGSKVTIIVFSGHSHPDMVRHTLAAGADAYIPKNGDFELLLDAIRDKRATTRNVAPDHPA